MRIGIIGAGKVGATIALLLADSAFCSEVLLGDLRAPDDLPKGMAGDVQPGHATLA